MRTKKLQNSASRVRRGSLTLELVLILPIILLVGAIIYQVSIMLMTYQAIQGASYVAVKVAARSDETSFENVQNEVKKAVETAVSGWYFASQFDPDNAGGKGKVSIFRKNGSGWAEIEDTSSWNLTSGECIAVQIKLTDLSIHAKQYWLLPQFTGVNNHYDSFTVNSVCVRKKSTP